MTLDEMRQWVAEGNGRRQIDVQVGGVTEAKNYVRARAYDYDLMEGQTFTEISEIDIAKVKREAELKQFEKLKAKYEGVKEAAV